MISYVVMTEDIKDDIQWREVIDALVILGASEGKVLYTYYAKYWANSTYIGVNTLGYILHGKHLAFYNSPSQVITPEELLKLVEE